MNLRAVSPAIVLLAFTTASATGSERALLRVRLIRAEVGRAGIDARLRDLTANLTVGPFTDWQQFRLVDEKLVDVAPGSRARFAMVDGRIGEITLLGRLGPRRRCRFRFESWRRGEATPNLSTVFLLDAGATLLVAGSAGAGARILGLSLVENP